jgi:sterol desaturase/sphingolipid hydroxylase (fatty acid hydroxylase superfamily)
MLLVVASRIEIPSDGAAIVRARQEGRDRLRARLDAARFYSPWLHLGATLSIGVVVLAAAIPRIHSPAFWEWLAVPAMFLVANAGEWRAHRSLLHRRVKPLQALYDRHTPEHHMVFGYDDMAIREWRELRLVLIPATGVAAIVAGTAPLAWLVGHFVSYNCGWLVLVTSALYVVTYEVSHLSFHLPPESFVGRLWLVRVLREQHRRHHHPRLMQRWNFNVTIPLWDWVRGTSVPRDVLERTLAETTRDEPAPAPALTPTRC